MRFVLRLNLGLLLLASLPLAAGFGLTTYVGLAARIAQLNYGLNGAMQPVPLDPNRFLMLQVELGAVGLLAGLGYWGLRPPGPRRAGGWAGRALGPLGRALAEPWRELGPAERGLALGLGLVVVGVRLYYAAAYPLSLDEIASYDYSVLPGPAVTASYYPFPNNHLGPNLLVGALHGLLPAAAPLAALRLLPTLAGLLSLPLVYLLALRYLRYGVATSALGLFWLSPLVVYYSVAGRGYAWTLLAGLAGLAAALVLAQDRPVGRVRRRAAWAVIGGSAILGLYAVPSHAWVVAGLLLALLVAFTRQGGRRRRLNLGHLLGLSLGIGLVAGVLYAPVGAVSGWPALLHNPYVARLPWVTFWRGVGPFLVGTATELLGQRGWSTAAYLAGLVLAPLALAGRALPAPARTLGWLLYTQYALWPLLAIGQGVFPPARTLLLVLLAFFVLVALLGQVVLVRFKWWLPQVVGLPLLALLLLGYGGYRLSREQAVVRVRIQQQAALRQVYDWLAPQAFARVWVGPREVGIILHHLALTSGGPALPLVVVADTPIRPSGVPREVQVVATSGSLPARAAENALYHVDGYLVLPVSSALPLVAQ